VTSCELTLAAPYACSSLALAASLFGVARAVRALLLLTSHQTVHWCHARGARAPAGDNLASTRRSCQASGTGTA